MLTFPYLAPKTTSTKSATKKTDEHKPQKSRIESKNLVLAKQTTKLFSVSCVLHCNTLCFCSALQDEREKKAPGHAFLKKFDILLARYHVCL